MASFIYNTRNHSREEFWRPTPPHITNGSEKCIVKFLEWPSGKYLVMLAPDDRSNWYCTAQPLTSTSVKELLERRPKQLRVMFVHHALPCHVLKHEADLRRWTSLTRNCQNARMACKRSTSISVYPQNLLWNGCNQSPTRSALTRMIIGDRKHTVSRAVALCHFGTPY